MYKDSIMKKVRDGVQLTKSCGERSDAQANKIKSSIWYSLSITLLKSHNYTTQV